jgi:hypothetical protein
MGETLVASVRKKIPLASLFYLSGGRKFFFVLEISRSHGSEYEDNSLLG